MRLKYFVYALITCAAAMSIVGHYWQPSGPVAEQARLRAGKWPTRYYSKRLPTMVTP
jgi:hypothetical protein